MPDLAGWEDLAEREIELGFPVADDLVRFARASQVIWSAGTLLADYGRREVQGD